MRCPTCSDATLVMTERQGIEIDYCPQCRGVWLDRGELDKLVERSVTSAAAPNKPAPGHRDYDDDSDDHRRYGQPGPRRKSWLNDIFD